MAQSAAVNSLHLGKKTGVLHSLPVDNRFANLSSLTRDKQPEEGPVNTGYMTSFCKDHKMIRWWSGRHHLVIRSPSGRDQVMISSARTEMASCVIQVSRRSERYNTVFPQILDPYWLHMKNAYWTHRMMMLKNPFGRSWQRSQRVVFFTPRRGVDAFIINQLEQTKRFHAAYRTAWTHAVNCKCVGTPLIFILLMRNKKKQASHRYRNSWEKHFRGKVMENCLKWPHLS